MNDASTIAVYLRVSTVTQKHDSQRDQIERWLASNGIDPGEVRWFADKESGRSLARPEFERLQREIFSGAVRTVVCWKLDRLSRSLRDGVNLLADWTDRGVRIVATSQQLDLSGPVGRMVAAVLLGLAEIELEHRRERQAAGIAVAKRRGRYKGRQAGSTKAKPARARELRDQGLTTPEIAAALNISERSVFRYLQAMADAQQ